MSDVHKNCLVDLGYLLREKALEARQSARAAKGTDNEAYQLGRQVAYHGDVVAGSTSGVISIAD
jgi:hypothetical protein